MTVINQSPVKTTTRKTKSLKVFQLFETDGSSSSDDTENYSPKSVVLKLRKSQTASDVFSRRGVRNQIERIRAEDSHLGEDIGECLIARVCYAGRDLVDDVTMFTRPASPLSFKVATRIDMIQ